MAEMVNRNFSLKRYQLGIVIAIVALIWFTPFSSVIKHNLDNITLVRNLSSSPYEYLFRKGSGFIKDQDMTGNVTWRFKLIDSLDNQVDSNDDQRDEGLHDIIVPNKREDLFWLTKGGLAYLNGDQDEAINAWNNHPRIFKYLISISDDPRDVRMAIKLWRLSLAKKPSGMGYYELGVYYLKTGDELKALDSFDLAILWGERENEPNLLSKIYIETSDIYLRQGAAELALFNLEKAQNLKVNFSPEEMVLFAIAYFKLERVEQAQEILKSALKIKHDIPRAWYWLGEVEKELGNTDDAIRAYQEYQKFNPVDRRVQRSLEILRSK